MKESLLLLGTAALVSTAACGGSGDAGGSGGAATTSAQAGATTSGGPATSSGATTSSTGPGGGPSTTSSGAGGGGGPMIVHQPDVMLPGAPNGYGSLALNQTTGMLYVAVGTGSGDAVAVVDTATAKVTATIAMPPKVLVNSVAVDESTNTVYAPGFDMAMQVESIAVIDGATNKITDTIANVAVNFIDYLTVDPSTHRLYGFDAGSRVAIIDGAAKSFLMMILLDNAGFDVGSAGITVDPATHTVYVLGPAASSGSMLTVIDGTAGTVKMQTPYTGTPMQASWDARDNGVLLVTKDPQTVVLDGPVDFKPTQGYTIAAISEEFACQTDKRYHAVVFDGAGKNYTLDFNEIGLPIGMPTPFMEEQANPWQILSQIKSNGYVTWSTAQVSINGSTSPVSYLQSNRILDPCP